MNTALLPSVFMWFFRKYLYSIHGIPEVEKLVALSLSIAGCFPTGKNPFLLFGESTIFLYEAADAANHVLDDWMATAFVLLKFYPVRFDSISDCFHCTVERTKLFIMACQWIEIMFSFGLPIFGETHYSVIIRAAKFLQQALVSERELM